MKKFLAVLLMLAMLLCGAAFAEDTAPALTKDVVVLFTSDVHCGIDQGWGYAGVANMRNSLQADNHVVLVDDGDAIQGETIGTLTKGSAIIELMNAVGYDIAIPGNHEFDYGMENFLELTKQANFPYISANFTCRDELVFAPYVIKEFDGVKIAFVGMTTPNTITPRPSTSRTRKATSSTASCRMKRAISSTRRCSPRWMRRARKAQRTSLPWGIWALRKAARPT